MFLFSSSYWAGPNSAAKYQFTSLFSMSFFLLYHIPGAESKLSFFYLAYIDVFMALLYFIYFDAS